MASAIGSCWRFLYRLHHHQFIGAHLDTWLSLLLVFLSLLAYLRLLPGDATLALASLLLLFLLKLSGRWARRCDYVHFLVDHPATDPGPAPPLWPQDKLLLHATGLFEVEARAKRFTELLAYYRTFETREHAIMARKTPSRFLWLGVWPVEELGMWYIFITPEALQAVRSGQLYHGASPRPALELRYIHRNTRKNKTTPERVYLSFDSLADRKRVHTDLLLDIGGPARRPWRP